MGETVRSKSAVEGAVNAIGWLHQTAGLPSIAGSPFIRAVLCGLQRNLAKPKVRKEPVTADMLSLLVGSLGQAPLLSDVHLAAVLLSYAAFLRCDEVSKLRCCDIVFSANSMSVQIRSSKTDQYRQGDKVLIARTGSSTYPVAMMEHYFRLGSLSQSSSQALFRRITKTKNGERLQASGSLSYTRIREVFMAKRKELGFDASKFGMHSLRSGGTSAAANAGVPDRLFKRHGCWRSETAKDGYIY